MPSCVELLGQAVGAVLGAGEDERLRRGAGLAQQVAQHRALLALRDQVHAVLDELGRRIARRDLDRERVAQQAVRERADLVRERRREQQVLAVRRQQREHAADVADEAHVEHAVGFVEDEVAHAAQVDVALVGVVEQAARRGDDDVDAAAQRVDLRARADAAEDQGRALAQVAAEVGEDCSTCAASSRVGTSTSARGAREPRGFGCSSCSRCSSGSAKAAVLPVPVWAAASRSRPSSTGGNAARLDGGGLRVAEFLDGTQEFGREAELFK